MRLVTLLFYESHVFLSRKYPSGLAMPVVTSSVDPNQWPAKCTIEGIFSSQSWASHQFVSGILEDRGERRSETSLWAVFGWNSNRERIISI